MMRKDHRGPRAPVAEARARSSHQAARARTRETREAAARWARHRSNGGLSLRKILPRQRELATRLVWGFGPASHLSL